MARLWRVAHFVLTDFLELSLEEMPANLTSYPAGIPATAPSALTASMHLGVLPEMVHSCSNLVACHAMPSCALDDAGWHDQIAICRMQNLMCHNGLLPRRVEQ